MSGVKEDVYPSWEFENDNGHIGGLDIYKDDKEVLVWVDDCYYDFRIPFDKFLVIAEKVKELQ